jgi:hypothetical protein
VLIWFGLVMAIWLFALLPLLRAAILASFRPPTVQLWTELEQPGSDR